MENNQPLLANKLNGFIKKYYTNELIKGGIYAVGGIISLLLIASGLEFIGRFDPTTRTALFFIFILGVIFVLGYYVIRPLLQLFNLTKRMDIQSASVLVGSHFPEVKDKLLNALQLEEGLNNQDQSLLVAAIQQKTAELKPVPFQKAIDFSKNLKYAKYAVFPVVLLLFIFLVSPGFIKSTERLVKYDQEFVPEAPFQFVVSEIPNRVVQDEQVDILLHFKGKEVPKESHVLINGVRILMRGDQKTGFRYALKSIRKNTNIQFDANGFKSDIYPIEVVKKPTVQKILAKLNFPQYLRKNNEILKNAGSITVPEGTKIDWQIDTRDVSNLNVRANKNDLKVTKGANRFLFSGKFKNSSRLSIKPYNEEAGTLDSLMYEISVIKDQFPQISIKKEVDSLSSKRMFFKGLMEDDYGFSKLEFFYKKTTSEEDPNDIGYQSTPITVKSDLIKQKFLHVWDLEEIKIKADDRLEYFFRIWDNDGVNGAKMTQSQVMNYQAPTLEQIKEDTEKKNEAIKNELAKAQADKKKLKKDIEDIQQKLTEKKTLSWEEKKKIEDILKKAEQQQQKVEDVIKQNKEKNIKESDFKPTDPDLLKKQEELEKLFEEVLDEETKDLMEKIRELLEQNNKEGLQEKLDEMKFSEKEMDKELDRMLELFKELELEKKVNETVDKLNKLAEEQQKLSEKTKDKENDKDDLQKEQEELNKEFDKTKKDLEDIRKKNSELEKPKDLSDTKKEEEETQEEMNESKDDLGNNKRKDAEKKQKNAAEKMKKMADQMQKSMSMAQMEQQMEDMNTLRQILENLVQLSFDQEHLIKEFKDNQRYNPKYVQLRQDQRKIKDDAKIVEDSLLALSKRVVQLEGFINKEIGAVNQNLEEAIAFLGERQTYAALSRQQYVMTGFNNLAVMLSEVLKQMQQQMKAQMESQSKSSGNKSCNNPKKGGNGKKPNMGAIKKLQDELSKQMKDLQNGMKQGGKKPGSKQFAEMAAQQAAIRQKMKDLQKQMEKEGKGKKLGDMQKTQDLMDDVEKDLVNKRLPEQTLQKLKEIEFRLLQHEKAEKQQEQDNKRKSNEGVDQKRDIPPSLQDYLNEQKKETELLKTVPPNLSPYYKQKVKQYFNAD